MDGSGARANCGPRRQAWRKAVSGLIRARHSHFRFWLMCTRWRGTTRRRWRPEKKQLNSTRTTWGRGARLDYVTSLWGNIDRPSNCSRRPCRRGNSDPRFQWAALIAFSHYLLGTIQYPAVLGARSSVSIIPFIFRCSRCGRRRWRNRDGARNGQGGRSPAHRFPDLTVDGIFGISTGEIPADTAHFRDELLKAGVPIDRIETRRA